MIKLQNFCMPFIKRWNLGIALAVLGLVLAIAAFLFDISSYKQDRADTSATAEQLSYVEEKIDTLAVPISNDFEGLPNFSGVWSLENAYKIAWPSGKYVKTYEGTTYTETITPTIEKSFFVKLNNEDVRVLITGTSEGACNACGVALSIFMFKKSKMVWYLVNEARHFTSVGRNGEMNWGLGLRDLTVREIGRGRAGIFIPINAWYQSEASEGYEIYSFFSQELVEIFSGLIRNYFTGYEKSEAIEDGNWYEEYFDLSFDIESSNFGFYDVIGEYSSTEIDMVATIRIKFDGEKYPYPGLSSIGECIKKYKKSSEIDINACL